MQKTTLDQYTLTELQMLRELGMQAMTVVMQLYRETGNSLVGVDKRKALAEVTKLGAKICVMCDLKAQQEEKEGGE